MRNNRCVLERFSGSKGLFRSWEISVLTLSYDYPGAGVWRGGLAYSVGDEV